MNIIESKIIIERSGEIFKKSLLSFEDDNGKNFSLRPDLTISACLDYIKNVKRGIYKYAYFDQAYRRTFSKESLVRNQLGCEIHALSLVSSWKYQYLEVPPWPSG